jgi:orotate phosphoribosyltransferase
VEIIRGEGAEPAAVVIALDRQEKGKGENSAVQEVEQDIGVPVAAIARLQHLVEFLETDADRTDHLAAIRRYRETYGV